LIEISQLWSSNATNLSFFIQYHADSHETVCEGVPDFSYEDTIVKDLECYDGWTDVGIFVYLDDELSLEECEQCKRPESDDESVVAYYFEVSWVAVDLAFDWNVKFWMRTDSNNVVDFLY